MLKKLLKEYKWQREHYLNGTLKYLLHKLGIIQSPSLLFEGIKPFKNDR